MQRGRGIREEQDAGAIATMKDRENSRKVERRLIRLIFTMSLSSDVQNPNIFHRRRRMTELGMIEL